MPFVLIKLLMLTTTPSTRTLSTPPVENQQEIVRFCVQHSLVLIADEVYQVGDGGG